MIEESLSNGEILVVDRYAYSGVAFTSAKGLDLGWCKSPDIGLPSPDVVFYLNLSIENAMERGGFGQERYEKKDFQMKVKEKFQLLKDESWIMIDANNSKDIIHQEIIEYSKKILEKNQYYPIKKLWID